MREMHEFLREEIAAILAEAPVPVVGAELGLSPIDVSPRAKKMRSIVRIAGQYGWHDAITHFLESRDTASILDLTNPQLDDLLDRMHGYVDAAETGCSLADCLPAS